MDPISIGASAISLHQRNAVDTQKNDVFKDVIASCHSLSHYEPNNIKTALPQIFVSIVAASFHIVIGISLAYSASLIPQIEADTTSDFKLTTMESSWVASIIVISVPFGCALAGVLMDWIGRLNTIKTAALPCVIGWIMIASCNSFAVMLIGRILTGLGCAMGTSPAIVYITEVARPDLRGSLISTAPTLASAGMVIAYAKGAFMDWRLSSWLYIIYSIIPIILIQLFVHESPVWLVSKGKMEEAEQSLRFLYKSYPQPDNTVQTLAEMHLHALQREQESKRQLRAEEESKGISKYAAFLKPTGYKPMNLLFWLFLIQQFSGIYITLFFAVTFIQDVGAEVDAFTASIFVGITRLCMSLLNAWLLKRFKRRPLIMISTIGMAVFMFISGACTLWIKEGHKGLSWVPVICLLMYVCFSMIGLLTIPWTMTAELFPTEIRGTGHTISYSMANVLMFVAVQSYRSLHDFLGGAHAAQWFFASVSVCGFFFALLILPETHGKKLSDIEAHFSGANKKRKAPPKQKPIVAQETEAMIRTKSDQTAQNGSN